MRGEEREGEGGGGRNGEGKAEEGIVSVLMAMQHTHQKIRRGSKSIVSRTKTDLLGHFAEVGEELSHVDGSEV